MSDQELLSLRLSLAVVNIDLQLYKASIYKQRWGTPGGNDQAVPCYDEAVRIIDENAWPAPLSAAATELRARLVRFREVLVAKDVTTASSEHTRLMRAFEAVREGVRMWPDGGTSRKAPATPAGADPRLHAGMEAPAS